MNSPSTSLHSLRTLRDGVTTATTPAPRRRWVLRSGVPATLVAAVILLLGWTLRDTIVPLPTVDAMPVVAVDGGIVAAVRTGAGEPSVVAQAPGWIEPDPFAVTVQSMVPGVVVRVLVLEGERVAKGDPLVELDESDAQLDLRRAHAELAESIAEIARAAATIEVALSEAAALNDELARLRPLAAHGGISVGDIMRLERRLETAERAVEVERATQRRSEATAERRRVAVSESELRLERKIIRAPMDGVVLARSVVPGTRIAMAGDGPGEAHQPGLLTLYDPLQLQVRADVPLADTGRIGLGTIAQITTEALPNRIFDGEVVRILHKADVQRNTIQAKVRMLDPDPQLKPEMLVRVRFLAKASSDAPSDPTTADARDGDGAPTLWIPASALVDGNGASAATWVAVPTSRRGVRALVRRSVSIVGPAPDGGVLVSDGLRIGDRVIADANAPEFPLRDGVRVRLRDRAVRVGGGD